MFSGIMGAPRSGKTYFYVNFILEEFKKYQKNSSKYRFIYTNINGLRFDAFKGFVKQYNKADFDRAMQQEFAIYSQAEEGLIDHGGDYDKWAIENGVFADYHHCLIIIDEAYGTFTTTYEDHKNRFLSYHGHWGIDVVFILQSKRQVNRRYLDHCEVFYVAKPSGKRFNSNFFRYQSYSTADIKKDNEIESTSLKFDKNVASFYNSGSAVLYKSFVLKKLMPLFFLIPALYFYFFVVGAPKYSKKQDENQTIQFSQNLDQHQNNDQNLTFSNTKKNEKPFSDEGVFLRAFCYPSGCRFEKYSLFLGEKNMLKLINIYKCQIVLYENLSLNLVHYYLRCDTSINEFLLNYKERGDETNIANDSSVK